MSFFKKLFCLHYYEDTPSVKYFPKFVGTANPTGFAHKKLMICNKCGKTVIRDFDFIDIEYLEN